MRKSRSTLLPILAILILSLLCAKAQRRVTPNRYNQRRRRHYRANYAPVKAKYPRRQLQVLAGNNTADYDPQKPDGDQLCRCLTAKDLLGNYVFLNYTTTDDTPQAIRYDLTRENITIDEYGIGCSDHYKDKLYCANLDQCTKIIPLPENCDKSRCLRSWCFVDSKTCGVRHKPSEQWVDVSYSFATCGHLDEVTHADRAFSLKNRTLKVALNQNTGGWMGAYHPLGRSFVEDTQWVGPVVRFMTDAARIGEFSFEITRPPLWLEEESAKVFGNSSFDYCVYATALGYLDLCVGDYTISTQRAAVASFFELKSNPIYLVVFTTAEQMSSWSFFVKQFWTIFQPFTTGVWAMILCVVLPLLGLLMFYHEHDVAGSAFPKEYDVQIVEKGTGRVVATETRYNSIWHRLSKSLYMSFLGMCHGGYETAVISVGGKIHLLAILCFLVLALAVYTANLAAILTTNLQTNDVDSLDEAIIAGYKFCASRRVSEVVAEIYDLDADQFIVADPVSEGGDGGPGFACPGCESRSRVFNFMKYSQDDPSLYCDAAFAEVEDLQAFHQYGLHCNKTLVGEILGYTTSGIPIRSTLAPQLTAWLYDRKYDGHLGEIYKEGVPDSHCPTTEELQEDGVGLTITQLAGIWGIVGALIVAGLVGKAINSYYAARYHKINDTGTLVQKVVLFDQWGNPVENPAILDEDSEGSEESEQNESHNTMEQSHYSKETRPFAALSLTSGTAMK